MASPNYGTSGFNSTYALTLEASGNLQLGFSRNPDKFGVLRWTETRPALKPSGYFLRIDPAMAMRSLYGNGADSLWVDGSPRPNMDNDLPFEAEKFLTQRQNFGGRIGRIGLESAEFLLKEISSAGYEQQCMTFRTRNALNVLSTTNWAGNASAVDNGLLVSGQNWTNGTTSTNNFRNSVLLAGMAIVKATGGVVTLSDLVLLMGPETALAAAVSPEITQMFIQSEYALSLAKGTLAPRNNWGLPSMIGNIRIEVEETPYNSALPGVTASNSFALAKGTAYLVCRPKGKEIVETADGKPYDYSDEQSSSNAPPITSTVANLIYKDMEVNVKDDSWDERVLVAVQYNGTYVVTHPATGYKLTACCG